MNLIFNQDVVTFGKKTALVISPTESMRSLGSSRRGVAVNLFPTAKPTTTSTAASIGPDAFTAEPEGGGEEADPEVIPLDEGPGLTEETTGTEEGTEERDDAAGPVVVTVSEVVCSRGTTQ